MTPTLPTRWQLVLSLILTFGPLSSIPGRAADEADPDGAPASPAARGTSCAPYLGMQPPGLTPEVFAPDLVPTDGYRLHGTPVFSPDGRRICWSVIPPAILTMSCEDGQWSRARIVGLGEATHGTAEFFELKHRLFRYLVEVHGHRALAYEYSFAGSLAIDRFVTTGEGDIDVLLAKSSWIQANEEVRRLLMWIREHNRTLPADKHVHFIGIDSQLDMWQ